MCHFETSQTLLRHNTAPFNAKLSQQDTAEERKNLMSRFFIQRSISNVGLFIEMHLLFRKKGIAQNSIMLRNFVKLIFMITIMITLCSNVPSAQSHTYNGERRETTRTLLNRWWMVLG